MASALESYVNRTVSIVTADGRNFIGTLKGFDQTINLILDDSHERVFSLTQGVEQVVLGLHIIRGDNIIPYIKTSKKSDKSKKKSEERKVSKKARADYQRSETSKKSEKNK